MRGAASLSRKRCWPRRIRLVCASMKKLIAVAYAALTIPLPGSTPEPAMIEAVRSGDVSKLRQLIHDKNGLNARGSQEQTALHEAAAKCSLEAAQLLVNAGVDKLIRDASGRTAAMIARQCPESESARQLVRLMLVRLPPKTVDETAPWSLHDAAAHGNAALVNMLLKMGSDVNAVGTKGDRPLEIACRKGNAQVTKALLDGGADLRLRTSAGTTVLHESALGGSAEIIEMLLARGADINAVDTESGATPLHFAASFGRPEAVKVLVRNGARLDRKNNKGLTALETAVVNGQAEIVALLRAAAAHIH